MCLHQTAATARPAGRDGSVLAHIDLRPATKELPFSGAATPRLVAWTRLREPAAIDVAQLVVLMDSLAPSLSAMLRSPTAIPTVSMTVNPTLAQPLPAGSFILVDATTRHVDDQGWIIEELLAWSETGRLVGHALQRRVVIDS